MNADPDVMRYFEKPLDEAESLAFAERIRSHIEQTGWGLWALEIKGGPEFAGFVGLSRKDFGLSFMPCVEIGWRLAKETWGHGYATEAALLALSFGREKFETIYSYTSVANLPSRRVMERLGLIERPELAFDHPQVRNSELKPHVVYST